MKKILALTLCVCLVCCAASNTAAQQNENAGTYTNEETPGAAKANTNEKPGGAASSYTNEKTLGAANPYITAGQSAQPSEELTLTRIDIGKGSTALLVGAPKAEPSETADLPPNPNRLLLVNYSTPIPQSYTAQLVNIGGGHKMDKTAAGYLDEMLSDARKEGLSPVIVSSYRTNKKQQSLFKRQINRHTNRGLTYDEAFNVARTVVAYPGTSEHELGLAADIVAKSYQGLDTKQEETAETKWLMENCKNYGFILRYPQDKSEITEIIYEPWHYRYVGVEAAKVIMENNLCLEEYIELLAVAEK
ncbi:MAG: M15 family metallopeptidase [Clostridiales bacterium]|jgi:D-alanyl-D-alanine carboxypeptidase|nr:M15 family metallopeptidase [Clostridiales bacterium]